MKKAELRQMIKEEYKKLSEANLPTNKSGEVDFSDIIDHIDSASEFLTKVEHYASDDIKSGKGKAQFKAAQYALDKADRALYDFFELHGVVVLNKK